MQGRNTDPEPDGDAHPVQARCRDIGKVLLGLHQVRNTVGYMRGETHDKGLVVLLHLGGKVGAHRNGERPFVDDRNAARVDVLFVQSRRDEGLGDQPASAQR